MTFDHDLDVNVPFSRFNFVRAAQAGAQIAAENPDEGLMPVAVAVRAPDLDNAKLLVKKGTPHDLGLFLSCLIVLAKIYYFIKSIFKHFTVKSRYEIPRMVYCNQEPISTVWEWQAGLLWPRHAGLTRPGL